MQKLLFYYCISTTYPIWTMTIFCDVGGGSVLCSLHKSFPICFLTTTKCSVYQLFGGCLRCGGKTVSVCRSINGCQAERTQTIDVRTEMNFYEIRNNEMKEEERKRIRKNHFLCYSALILSVDFVSLSLCISPSLSVCGCALSCISSPIASP